MVDGGIRIGIEIGIERGIAKEKETRTGRGEKRAEKEGMIGPVEEARKTRIITRRREETERMKSPRINKESREGDIEKKGSRDVDPFPTQLA